MWQRAVRFSVENSVGLWVCFYYLAVALLTAYMIWNMNISPRELTWLAN